MKFLNLYKAKKYATSQKIILVGPDLDCSLPTPDLYLNVLKEFLHIIYKKKNIFKCIITFKYNRFLSRKKYSKK